MNQVPDFDYYFLTKLISDEDVEGFIDVVGGGGPFPDPSKNLDYARFYLGDIVPSIHTVLGDIHRKAGEYANLVPLVRKPQSRNAAIHYFVRILSGFVKTKYGQPLHDAVAMTACTVFQRDDIDSDYVRKLVAE